jgi:hypothetical protein
LTGVAFEEGLRATLHLDSSAAELPDRQTVKNRRLPGVISAPEKGDAGMQIYGDVAELLETMERDPRNHGRQSTEGLGCYRCVTCFSPIAIYRVTSWQKRRDEGETGSPAEAATF